MLPLLPFYAMKLNASPAQIGLLFSSYSLTQLLFSPLLGRLSDRVGRRPVMLVSVLGSAFAHLMFATADSFALLVVARSLAGVAAANYSIAQAWMADVTTAENRSKAMGLVGAAFGIGFVLGPALGSVLALTPMGAPAVPYAAAALSGLNFLIALAWLPESLPKEVRERSRTSRGSDSGSQARANRKLSPESAAAANGTAGAPIGVRARTLPSAGPTTKPIPNAAPIRPMALERFSAVVTSAIQACAML
jgi:multidrug resistance protein